MIRKIEAKNRLKEPDKRKKERIVRIFNLSEDVWSFIESIGDPMTRKAEIEENANLADRDLFSMAEEFDFTFISAKKLDPTFVAYFIKLCEVRDLEVMVPENHSGLLCEDVMKDENLFDRLCRMGKKYQKLTLIPYSSTQSFYALVEALEKRGVVVSTPFSPKRKDLWTVNHYGSKSGIRQVVESMGRSWDELKMAEGKICFGVEDTAKVMVNKYLREKGVVVKTNKGHAGMGVLIYRKGDLRGSFEECERKVIEDFRKDSYWEKYPIVVESFVEANRKIGGGFPNVEFLVDKRGRVELLYFCGMRVDKKGVFGGVEISDKVLPKKISSRITYIGYLLGEQYAKDGYRGYFDIDFIVDKKGAVHVSESNVRVTGGTHVYHASVELAGKNFTKNSFVLSDNIYVIPSGKKYAFGVVHELLEGLLYDRKKKEGVVIASSNMLLHGKLSYIVIGKSRKRAEAIEKKMKEMVA